MIIQRRGLTEPEAAAGKFSPAVSKEVLSGQDVRRKDFGFGNQ